MRWPRLPPSYSFHELIGSSSWSSHEAGVVGLGGVAHVVEHEELGLGAEIDGVADAHGLDHGFGLAGDAAGIAVIGLAGGRLEHVADEHQRRLGEERVDAGGGGVRHQAHVGLVDRLPAGDRGAVEHLAFRERLLLDHPDVEGHVLPLAARIGEPEIAVLYVVVLDQLQDIFGRRHVNEFLSSVDRLDTPAS